MESYRAAKEDSPAAAPAAPSQAAGPRDLSWDAPAGWTRLPVSGMRVASFGVGGRAELSVVALPGEAGGVLANVNRWRGQLGLAGVDQGGLDAQTRRIASGAGELLFFDIRGKAQADGTSRLAVAVLSTAEQTWFFKLAGPDEAVARALASFQVFLRSLRRAG